MNTDHLFQIEMPADHALLQTLGETINALIGRIDHVYEREIFSYNVQLAVHEVCVNCIEHGYAGRANGRISIDISLIPSPRRLRIEIRDYGESFDITSVPAPNLDEPQIHGYGLFLIHELMDEVTYTTVEGENRWLLVKRVDP